jgi:hypothetical protein
MYRERLSVLMLYRQCQSIYFHGRVLEQTRQSSCSHDRRETHRQLTERRFHGLKPVYSRLGRARKIYWLQSGERCVTLRCSAQGRQVCSQTDRSKRSVAVRGRIFNTISRHGVRSCRPKVRAGCKETVVQCHATFCGESWLGGTI